jgi:triosephosphate isomerase
MKRVIIANWKMSPPTIGEARRLFENTKRRAQNSRRLEVVLAPPFIYLPLFRASRGLRLGAQDVFFKDPPAGGGAYTGEISPKMLKALGVSYVILGHSERREYLGESNELINKKLKASLARGLKVILCVGEHERSKDKFPQIIKVELKKALEGVPRRFANRVLVAYEPIWAVGSGKPDTPQELFEMSIFIRRTLLDIWGRALALKIPIIYGGSVNSKNVKNFLEVDGISGLLVGASSLDASEFGKILEIANKL